MTINEKKKELLKLILSKLINLGFDKKIYGQSFRKPVQDGHGSVHLSFINHTYDFDVTIDFAVRIDKLEDLINKYNQDLKEKEKKETASIGVELGNLLGEGQKRWTIEKDEDIEIVVTELYQYIVKVGIPYIDRYSNLETAYNIFMSDDEEGQLSSPFNHVRAMNAVGMAMIMNRPDIKEIINYKMNYLVENNDNNLCFFQDFIKNVTIQDK